METAEQLLDTIDGSNDEISPRLDLLGLHLKEIRKTPLLTREEEVSLMERIREGDQFAWELMVRANMPLVVSIAKRYSRKSLSLMDCIQDGYFGLFEAIQRYDETRGHKFATYAKWWIRNKIRRGLDDTDRTIRIPVYRLEQMRKFASVRDTMRQKLQREPSHEETLQEMRVARTDAIRDSLKEQDILSLDSPIETEESDDEMTLHEVVPHPANGVEERVVRGQFTHFLRERVRGAMDVLSGRQADIITRRFGLDGNEPRTLDDIGIELGLTRERVRQIEADAMILLRPRIISFLGESIHDIDGLEKVDLVISPPAGEIKKFPKAQRQQATPIRRGIGVGRGSISPALFSQILQIVAGLTGTEEEEIVGESWDCDVAWARQYGMYLLHEVVRLPHSGIAVLFHINERMAAHGWERVSNRIKEDEGARRLVGQMKREVRSQLRLHRLGSPSDA